MVAGQTHYKETSQNYIQYCISSNGVGRNVDIYGITLTNIYLIAFVRFIMEILADGALVILQ